MAIQHLFAWSSMVDGALIAAGSPFGCGQQVFHSVSCYFGGLDTNESIRYVHRRYLQNLIDDPVNLRRKPVVLFSGKNDWVVWTKVMESVEQQIVPFLGVPPLKLFDSSASHVWSLDHGQCSCGSCAFFLASDLCCNVNNCGLDLSGRMLTAFSGVAPKPRVSARAEGLRWVDQWQYMPEDAFPKGNASTLLQWAIVYVPSGCEGEQLARCARHINYHGCTDNTWSERLLWVDNIDLNEYAEANDIVVVYPQAAGSVESGVGCWNWASYEDDPLFDTKHGVQLQTILKLVDHLPDDLPNAQRGDSPPSEKTQLRSTDSSVERQ